MKFGKEFRTHLEETLPDWRDKFLCYKPLKKLLKRFPDTHFALSNIPNLNSTQPSGSVPTERNMSLQEFQEWFVRLLNEELEKFNDFYVEKEEDFVIRFQELKERIERLIEQGGRNGLPTSEREFSEEMVEIRKEFVTIHGEMVLLKNYSSLNFAGLVKILKKYDKRTGGLLRLPFTQLAAHQPFFTTEPLTGLVRECEANLELLFPLEEEVTDSTPASRDQNQSNPPLNDITNIPDDASSLGDVYRSTLSAIRTIQGLRMSSTYNPFSFAALFRNQEEEGSGAVTAENSASNAAPPTQGEDSGDHEDAGSAP